MDNVIESIRTIHDFPKPGIAFRDITTLLTNPKAYQQTIQHLIDRYKNTDIDAIVGLEARGFLFSAPVAYELGLPLIPIRKPGKLPFDTHEVSFEKEYGTDTFELHSDALKSGQRVIIIDDLIATGGTIQAAIQLIEKSDAIAFEAACIIELEGLCDHNQFSIPIHSLVKFPA